MSRVAHISAEFLQARRKARALPAFPGDVPQTLDQAYAVQASSTAAWGEPVLGYKVGGIAPQWREQYPSNWLAGPVFESLVFEIENEDKIDIPVFDGGFAAYEPELILQLENLSDLTTPIETIETAKRFVSKVHIGAEIASSPLASINDFGPGSIISDFGNQAGIVIGPEIERDWLDRIDEIDVMMHIDEKLINRASPKGGEDGPLGALRFLLNHLGEYAPNDGLSNKIWLSSGAITGVHKSEPGTVGRFDYGALGTFEIEMVKRQPGIGRTA